MFSACRIPSVVKNSDPAVCDIVMWRHNIEGDLFRPRLVAILADEYKTAFEVSLTVRVQCRLFWVSKCLPLQKFRKYYVDFDPDEGSKLFWNLGSMPKHSTVRC
jgi:hypothetical protein